MLSAQPSPYSESPSGFVPSAPYGFVHYEQAITEVMADKTAREILLDNPEFYELLKEKLFAHYGGTPVNVIRNESRAALSECLGIDMDMDVNIPPITEMPDEVIQACFSLVAIDKKNRALVTGAWLAWRKGKNLAVDSSASIG